VIDGVLVVDKPAGLTSHDVVASARRALGESRIGHTGTLDPLATGVLALACGRATRLVQFLAASDKDYEAEIRIGLTTDTYDVTGREVARTDHRPSSDAVAAMLATFEGSYLQAPPAFSAKKIGGRRAYDLARADVPVKPAPVPVTAHRVELLGHTPDVATVRLTCSAGFYVRSLAHDLGLLLGSGACLQSLRRTRSGEFHLGHAVTIDVLASDATAAAARVLPIERLLSAMPAATLTEQGVKWVTHGRVVGAGQASGPLPQGAEWVRLMSPDQTLVALARPVGPGSSLHPSVVLI
jgi:tRNA pseudouridine55 synthase